MTSSTTSQSPKSNHDSTVLITGACGFIGSHLVEKFLSLGFRVIGVDNFSTAYPKNLPYLQGLPQAKERFAFFEKDASQPWSWFNDLKPEFKHSLKIILHFASPASPPLYQKLALETIEINTNGLKHALQTALPTKAKVVFASTSEIYGDPLEHPQRESYFGNVNTLGPRSCYDESKRLGESLLHTWNLVHGTKHGLVRIFNTYGPRMNPVDGGVIINFLTQAMKGEDLTIYGDGSQTRSFCFVDDLVTGITSYALNENLVEPINLGNPSEMSIFELAQVVCKIFRNAKISTSKIPLPTNDPAKRRPDISRAKSVLHWTPTVSLESGLEKMVGWLRSEI